MIEPTVPSDEQLMAGAGGRGAFEALFERYREPVWRFFRRRAPDASQAEKLAQRRNLAQRVTYATVTLDVREEQKASLDLGPSSVSTRLRNAAVDGFRAASSSIVAAALLVARIAPVLLLWSLILAWPVRVIWRRAWHR